MVMEFADEVGSTQLELVEMLRFGVVKPPFMLVARRQTSGVGSRGNEWESGEGNLMMSFCVEKNALPSDLPSNSASIYFAFLMVLVLRDMGSQIWLKWPNDFYICTSKGMRKAGGVMTTKFHENFVCGMGLNLKSAPKFAGVLDVEVMPSELAVMFCKKLEEKLEWKQIFRKFMVEFERSRSFGVHQDGEVLALKDAKLMPDGSVLVGSRRLYSLR